VNESSPATPPFRLEEATIDQMHQAIRDGHTTCVKVVEHYLKRVRAFNGASSMLITEDGRDVDPASGAVRGGAPIEFPTKTIKASDWLPDLDRYQGPPIEFGRMDTTASDPEVAQQFGMIAGIPDAGRVNALSTINIRGERSVTCKGEFDRHPSLGPLPPGAPPMCDEFRHQPDALERAAELDAQYGRNPDLEKMPMYGVVFSFKDPFDTKDMRSTGGGDTRYDIDVPARDHVLVDQLRAKGAIIFAKAVCTEYNGRAADPGGRHLRFARLQLRVRCVGQHQHGDGEPGRGDAGLLPGPVQPQLGGADPAAQVDDRLRWWCDRRGHLCRPHGHPVPGARRLRKGARCAEGPRARLLRPAR
jgi:hypothetical protein